MNLFLYGTLRHDRLLAAVAGGGPLATEPAVLREMTVRAVRDHVFPLIAPAPGGLVEGLLLRDVTPGQLDRIDLYEGSFGYWRAPVEVDLASGGTARAEVYLPPEGLEAGGPWSLDDWVGQASQTALHAVEEIFAHDPPLGGEALLRQWGMVMARAEAKARAAAEPAPARLRRTTQGEAAGYRSIRPLAGAFFKFDTLDTWHDRFDGRRAEGLIREVLVAADAALVLPYDPLRDRVLLIEQVRTGPLRRGDPDPWCLEPVAGLVDPGETPVEAAARECVEEAGIVPRRIERMFAGYASPGSTTEFFHCFLGLADLPDGGPGFGGLDGEGEDIRVHRLTFDAALDLVATGEVNVTPLVAMLMWLAHARPRLREAAGAA